MRSTAILCALAALLAASAGCASPPPAQAAHKHLEWMRNVAALGMVPVMPLDEDIRVGDIYVYPRDPASTFESLENVVRWSALPVTDALKAEYRERGSWPKTPHPQMDDMEPTEPVSEIGVFAPEEPVRRLRAVAMSSFTAKVFTGADVNVVIPVEAVNLTGLTGLTAKNSITMKGGAAEKYALSMSEILERLLDPVEDEGRFRHFLKEEYRRNLVLVAKPESDRLWVRVITEVIYLRSIDYALEAVLPEDEQEEDEVKVSELTREPEPGEEPDEALDPAYGAFVRANAINEELADHDMDENPTGFIRFLSVTNESVTLRYYWNHGVAVAVRGLTLVVAKETGEVLEMRPMADPSLMK